MMDRATLYLEITRQITNELKQLRRLQYLLDNNIFDLDEEILKALKAHNYNYVLALLGKRLNRDLTKKSLIDLARQTGVNNYSKMSKSELFQALLKSGVNVYD